jgi:RimJ/RimL family protein N-acetyltransferase
VKLRDVGPDDLALWERLRCDPAMNTELGGPQPREEIPGKLAEDVAAVSTDTSWISVVESDGGKAMGSVCIWTHAGDVPFTEIGWGVLPEFQGQGVGKRSVATILERARNDGRWGTIHAFPAVSKAPSNGICRSLGFTLIGQEAFEFRGTTLQCNHWQIDPAEALDPLP